MTMSAQDFVAHEAALLDTRRFDDWLALFAEDGRYWVPLQGEAQADAENWNSIALEDRLLLSLRVARLKSPRAHSQHPPSHCRHVLQQSRLRADASPAGEAVLETPFMYVEARGPQQIVLAGACVHRLVGTGEGWLIREKRVNLLNPGQPLPAIQLFI